MVMAVRQFEKLFRESASLDIDKSDIKRLEGFVNKRLHSLLVRGVANARANGRDVIQPQDLPVTRGLQEQLHAFRKLDEELDLSSILEQLSQLPPLELAYGEEVERLLPQLTGGITVAVAHCLKTLQPKLKNPSSSDWEQAERIFDILL